MFAIHPLIAEFRQSETFARLAKTQLVFTVTSGRSGTKLLTELLARSLGVAALHEPEPRANFELRSTIEHPEHGLHWLIEEKLPQIAEEQRDSLYIETSHLYCKGFIELLLQLGLQTRFIILRRDPKAIARSLFQMSCVPERTDAGKLVLIGPSDPGVLALPNWEKYSDYQLCYWYAKEIERRQAYYVEAFDAVGIPAYETSITDLLDWAKFTQLCKFIAGSAEIAPNREAFVEITAVNQNPRNVAAEGSTDRTIPVNADEEEREVEAASDGDISTVKHMLPIIVAPKQADRPIRVWSPRRDSERVVFWSERHGGWIAAGDKTGTPIRDIAYWSPV